MPNDDAAPQGVTTYRVAGTLSYVYKGVTVEAPLFPSDIRVLPNAKLTARYFWPRDVHGDNPFTYNVEPSEPFPVAVLMTNHGAGVAQDVRITSYQPQIVDNDKGLLVGFKLVGRPGRTGSPRRLPCPPISGTSARANPSRLHGS